MLNSAAMSSELSFREKYPDANSSFYNWLIPHWKKYGIIILELIPTKNEDILKIVGTKVYSEEGRDFQEQLIHDLSNLASIHYLGEGDGHLESLEAEEAEIESLINYASSAASDSWSIPSWVDFIGNSKK